MPGSAEEWGPAGGGEMGSVDEGDVERQQEGERKEQWAENLEREAETTPAGDSAASTVATPAADAAHEAADAAADNGSQPSEASNGSQPGDADGTPVRHLARSIPLPVPASSESE